MSVSRGHLIVGSAVLLSLAALSTFGLREPALAQGAAPTCTSSLGGRIMLQSDAVDPDVFVWDSRDRLVEYAAGRWGTTRAVFSHTVLAEPGTQAAVVACVPGVAHPKFSTDEEDAIGVRILSGMYRGKYGWVLSGDAHAMHAMRDGQQTGYASK